MLAALLGLIVGNSARSQFEYEDAPILYATAPVDEPASRLAERIARGEVKLEAEGADEDSGRLRELLQALDVPISSQVLVFSKTSFQRERIGPQTPRAIYFSDEVYVGYVPGSRLLEITAYDPHIGPVFYAVEDEGRAPLALLRQNHDCTQCHASAMTRGVPGHLVRSVYPDRAGLPNLRNGSFLTDHRSRLEDRWGGWYVTGRHGAMRHLGNQTFSDSIPVEKIDREPGANLTTLTKFDTSRYLTPHSDIVALMVLEHQTMAQNQITQAIYQTKFALRDAEAMNKALERPADFRSESISRRIRNAAESIVKVLLFVDEAPLTDRIEGTSGFAEEFAARGPKDAQGRSLRELQLAGRMFKYPCSYVIYSRAIAEAPTELREVLFARLAEILSSEPAKDDYAHLSNEDRRAIREILTDTLPEFRAAVEAR